jgi:excisionase family DNA binding protein
LDCGATLNRRLFEAFRKLPVDCLPPDLFTKTLLVQTTPQPGTKKPNGAPNPAGYDLAGAAAHLGMSQRKLREMVKARRIACTRIDYRNFLFAQADLDEFLATYRTKPKRI